MKERKRKRDMYSPTGLGGFGVGGATVSGADVGHSLQLRLQEVFM